MRHPVSVKRYFELLALVALTAFCLGSMMYITHLPRQPSVSAVVLRGKVEPPPVPFRIEQGCGNSKNRCRHI